MHFSRFPGILLITVNISFLRRLSIKKRGTFLSCFNWANLTANCSLLFHRTNSFMGKSDLEFSLSQLRENYTRSNLSDYQHNYRYIMIFKAERNIVGCVSLANVLNQHNSEITLIRLYAKENQKDDSLLHHPIPTNPYPQHRKSI